MTNDKMSKEEALRILNYHRNWISGDIRCIDEVDIFKLSEAIKVVIELLSSK